MGRVARLFFVLLCCLCLPLTASAAQKSPFGQKTGEHRLVAGTELIADIVRDLLPEPIEILVLVPAAACPGHHDMRAADMAFFSIADMVLVHGWQRKAPGLAEAAVAAKLGAERMKTVQVYGSFLVPEHQIAASREIARYLAAVPGVDAGAVDDRLEKRVARISALAGEKLALLAPYRGTPVLSAEMQAEFVRWTGMDVKGEYGRAEDLSPATLMQLTDTGKKTGVKVVVDNLQSGAEAGLPLARELGAAHVGFSNFPGYIPEAPDYASLLSLNVQLLLKALERP